MSSKILHGHLLIGKKIPAADGGDYGHFIVGYDEVRDDLLVVPIKWSTGEVFPLCGEIPQRISRYKASYRYMLHKAQ